MKKIVYSLMLSSALFASNYEDGMKSYQSKDYNKAMEFFKKAGELDNDSRSIRNLGIMYASGIGVKKDTPKAIKLLKKASKAGDSYAGFSLGNMYAQGDGVTKDFKEAALWFTKAADAGDVKSMTNLAYLYTYGDGVEKDLKKAFTLYEKSAAGGYIDAQINVAFLYISGRGVKKDMSKAAYWAKKVKDTGDERVNQIWEQFELEKYVDKK